MTDGSPCCAPKGNPAARPAAQLVVPAGGRSTRGQVRIPAGRFAMGDHFDEGYAADGETPVHEVELDEFWLDATTVTNTAFATFAKATQYETVAEREGTSMVFHLALADQTGPEVLGAVEGTPWWLSVRGASWRHPEGPNSDVTRRANHPVVHIAHEDAVAYAMWAGKRLPTEAEWEYAARGAVAGARFAWGNELTPRGRHQCNIWQGDFPVANSFADGHLTTAPVKTYPPNGFGLFQMAGNVWEWCSDWFAADYYEHSPTRNPAGAPDGEQRVMRGGSYLCHDSYCNRYRVSARSHNTPSSTSGNLGFRCANDA